MDIQCFTFVAEIWFWYLVNPLILNKNKTARGRMLWPVRRAFAPVACLCMNYTTRCCVIINQSGVTWAVQPAACVPAVSRIPNLNLGASVVCLCVNLFPRRFPRRFPVRLWTPLPGLLVNILGYNSINPVLSLWLQIRTRNDVRPAQNTMVSVLTHDQPGKNAVESQKELHILRQEILRMKKDCKCLVIIMTKLRRSWQSYRFFSVVLNIVCILGITCKQWEKNW